MSIEQELTEEALTKALNKVFDEPLKPTTYVLPQTWLDPFLAGDWRYFASLGTKSPFWPFIGTKSD